MDFQTLRIQVAPVHIAEQLQDDVHQHGFIHLRELYPAALFAPDGMAQEDAVLVHGVGVDGRPVSVLGDRDVSAFSDEVADILTEPVVAVQDRRADALGLVLGFEFFHKAIT